MSPAGGAEEEQTGVDLTVAEEEEEGAALGNRVQMDPSPRSGASVAVTPRAGAREVVAEATQTGTISVVARMTLVGLAVAAMLRTAAGAVKTGVRPETCRLAGAEVEVGRGWASSRKTSGSRRMVRVTTHRGGRLVIGAGAAHSSKMMMGRAGGVVASVAEAVAGASCLHLAVAGAEGEAVAGATTGPTQRMKQWTAATARQDGTEVTERPSPAWTSLTPRPRKTRPRRGQGTQTTRNRTGRGRAVAAKMKKTQRTEQTRRRRRQTETTSRLFSTTHRTRRSMSSLAQRSSSLVL